MSSTNPPPGSLAAILAGMRHTSKNRYLHVGFSFSLEALADEVQGRIQTIFDQADDWLRYSRFCWILWSGDSPQEWYSRLIAIPELKQSNILIAPIDVSPENRYGQLGQFAWDWLNKQRT